MEKIVWVIGNEKKQMIESQRQINSVGSMRAVCMLSDAAVKRSMDADKYLPDLILLDYDMLKMQDFEMLTFLKEEQALTGVPLFFMVEERTVELDEDCYKKGAVVVVHKPFTSSELLRIERTAWQHDVTKNYEKMLQKQASELRTAKEILILNEKLKQRNELLYKIFGRYFSDHVVNLILDDSEGASIGGEKKEMTVMMADLRGFTSASEEMDSDSLMDILNTYFGKMSEIIMRYRGTIIEFLGDAVLAVFGLPTTEYSHADDAVAAAIHMQNAMTNMQEYCEERGYPNLEMGIGIHSGEAFIGNVGSELMMRYNVIGKIVNECSRIESYSIGGQVLVSEETAKQLRSRINVEARPKITAKGIQRPITVCEVTGIEGEYCCSLENAESDRLVSISDWVLFNMYPVIGKLISDEPIAAVLKQFSRKRAVVEMECDDARLSLYTDVEIFAAGKDGRAVFTGVYAKVVQCEDKQLTLHFTHVNKAFQEYTDAVFMSGD